MPTPPSDDHAFVERIVGSRAKLTSTDLARLRPLLAQRSIPARLRIHAAAAALRSVPDSPEAVRGVVRPLTSGLSPLRRLERLRQLQNQIEICLSLDALIERRDARLKMDCPRCGRRYPRETMVRHLWHEHGLLLERGKIRSPQRTVRELKEEHAASHDTTVLDRASLLASDDAIRAWVADSEPNAEDTAPLIEHASEHGCGLCPGCFQERRPALPPLPPPLTATPTRLAGDGDAVQIRGGDGLRALVVTSGARTIHFGPEGRGTFGTRGLAILAATLVLAITFTVVVFGPRSWAGPSVVVRLLLLAAASYALIRILRKPPARSDSRMIDAAWIHLAPRRLQSNRPAPWLTRLCRSSLGTGDPEKRAAPLAEILERFVEDAALAASAAVLQADDRARLGHDRAAAMAEVIGRGLRGEATTGLSEYAAQCYLSDSMKASIAEQARLRTMLLAAAFEAGFQPRDLDALWTAAPHLKRVMGVEPLHRLALLLGVWQMQTRRGWERFARAETVFELCRTSPNISGRLLAEFPDLLLCHRPDPDTEAQLGPVLICTRGVVVGGRMLADPLAEVRIEKAAGPELHFGPHRFPLERTPQGDFAGIVREWLRFRAWVLLPLLDNYLVPTSATVAARALKPFQSRCPKCGTVAVIRVGM